MGPVIDPNRLTPSGERCVRRLDRLAALGLPPEQFVTAVTTPVEAHVSRMIGYLILLSDIDRSALGRALIEAAEDAMTRNWTDRTDWLARGFEISVRDRTAWQRFDTVVQARNALVHGDGFLSDQQLALTLTKLLTLKRRLGDELGVSWSGGRLAFDSSSARAAHDAARTFVADLDERILAKFPQVSRL